MYSSLTTKQSSVELRSREPLKIRHAPLSAEQRRFWLLQQMDPEGSGYNIPYYLHLRGALDWKAMQKSLSEIVRRHEILRTRFPWQGSDAVQEIHPPSAVLLPVVDVSGLDRETSLRVASDLRQRDSERPFNLGCDRLFRATLLRLSKQEHQLLLTMHHIVADGWSEAIIAEELQVLYPACLDGRSCPLPDLPAQYEDYAIWQQKFLDSDEIERDTEYWREQLAGLTRPVLPSDYTPQARNRSLQRALPFRLVPKLGRQLEEFGRQERATLFVVLLAGFQWLLSLYTGSEDIPVGTAVATRSRSETEDLIGPFLNTIVLRTKTKGAPSFRELIRRVREVTKGGLIHQGVPFEKVVEAVTPPNAPGETPLFQAVLVLQNVPGGKLQLPGLDVEEGLGALLALPFFDLMIELKQEESTKGLTGFVSYRADIFKPSSMELLARQYQLLLERGVHQPEVPLTQISLLTAEEERGVFKEWQGRERKGRRGTMDGLWEEEVGRRGAAVAMEGGEEQVSYVELEKRANQLARYLRKQGVRREMCVGVCVERSIAMVVGLLGIVKAGAAYVPLDPSYPSERLREVIGETEAGWVVTEKRWQGGLEGAPCRRVCVDGEEGEEIGREETGRLELGEQERSTESSLAYVMFTSGSSGRPKGVGVVHGGVVRLVEGSDCLKLDEEERMLQLSPLSFDASTLEIWGALLKGGRLVMAPAGSEALERLGEVIRRHQVSTMFLTAALLDQIARTQAESLAGVRQLVTGGDVVSAESVRLAGRQGCRVINGYGPTENTTFTACYTIEVGEGESLGERVPIGRPICGTQVYVLDRELRPAPVGVVGDLYTGGEGLARGYWKDAGLTAEKFIPDPYSGKAGARLYATGDRARYRGDGVLEFMGRQDRQVKVRGYRIELGEIEARLQQHEGVREAVVVLRQDRPQEKRLVAYATPVPGWKLLPLELHEFLRNSLPAYMVPSAISTLDCFPLTPTGKVDRSALPEPEYSHSAQTRAPHNRSQTLLCGIVSELLAVPQVGLDDNFFRLGGDSISSIQLISRARQAGLLLTMRDIFRHETIEFLAAAAANLADAEQPVADDAAGDNGIVPTTPIIHWLLDRAGPTAHFSQSLWLRTPPGLKKESMIGALQALLDHHDALRMRVLPGRQRKDSRLTIDPAGARRAVHCLRYVSLAGADDHELGRRMAEEQDEAQQRLSPDDGVMLQVVWLDCGGHEQGRVLLTLHHMVVDGVSWRILLPDLAGAAAALSRGNEVNLPKAGTPFRLWAARLAADANTPRRMDELGYWRNLLQRSGVKIFPQKLDPQRDTWAAARQLSFELECGVTSGLLTLVPAFHARLNDLLIACLAVAVLKAFEGQGSGTGMALLVDVESHGREEIFAGMDLSRTVGWFTSMFPVRLDLAGHDLGSAELRGSALARAVKKIKEDLRGPADNGLGYGLLRYLNGETSRELACLERPQIGFNYLGRFAWGVKKQADWEPVGETLGGSADPTMPMDHGLEIDARVLDGSPGPKLLTRWAWAPALVSEGKVHEIAQHWRRSLELLAMLSAQPAPGGLTPSDIPLVTLAQDEIDALEQQYGVVDEILPLAPLQEGLLFHAVYAAQSADVYLVQLLLILEGKIDEAALRSAVEAVLRRHPNLRASFKSESVSKVVQVIAHDVPKQWRTVDLTAFEERERERLLQELLVEDRARPFDPAQAPLLRFILVRLSAREYRLLITHHHILLDGWSLGVMIHEMLVLYEENDANLPVPTPYREYLAWLAAWDRKEAETAWRNELSGLEPTHLASMTTPVEAFVPGRLVVYLPEELTLQMQEQARQQHCTVNTVIQAAWTILLGRQTGREDLVFGTTMAGRPGEIPGIERMVGLFINTLPVRVQLRAEDRLSDLLLILQEKQLWLQAWQYIGLTQIQRVTGTRDLFDTLLVFENFPEEDSTRLENRIGFHVSGADVHDATHYPLSLVVGPGRRLKLRFDYRPDLFDENDVRALSRRFRRLVEAMVAEPQTAVLDAPLLEAGERQQLLVNGKGEEKNHPSGKCVPELIAARAGIAPHAIALVHDNARLSYLELEQKVSRLAQHLQERGVGRQVSVGVFLERGLELVAAMLAVWKLGGVYVPLDTSYPKERLAFLLQDAHVQVLLVEAATLGKVPSSAAQAVCVNGDWKANALTCPRVRQVPLHPQDLAYVMYTSGSTGLPKGVMIEHGAMANHLWSKVNDLGLSALDVVAQTASSSFDISVWQMLAALLVGGQVHIFSDKIAGDPFQLLLELQRSGVTVLETVPVLLGMMVGEEENKGGEHLELNTLRWMISNAEAFPVSLCQRWNALFPHVRVLNTYGATECADDTSHYFVPSSMSCDSPYLPLGNPVSNLTTYVLDSWMRPVPVGVAAELYIGGTGVGRGYLDRPGLTAERFVPDPFSAEPGKRIYRTGDLGRWRRDGSLEFVGRRDHQVKLRGHRVEPGEIESALLEHEEISQTAVLLREDEPDNRRLVAYVVLKNSTTEHESSAMNPPSHEIASLDSDEQQRALRLREFLAARLPEYLVPTAYVALEALPLNANGKVDREALPAPARNAGQNSSDAAPRNYLEAAVCSIWSQLLHVDQVGIHDNFFLLGGDSIVAIQVAFRVRALLRCNMPLTALFRSPTVAALAQELERLQNDGGETTPPPLVPVSRERFRARPESRPGEASRPSLQ
jgi:amino acid adenylation domain-containing protein/non-ribosomal peptide synthase protein (TIGR01720 family)